MQKSQQSVPDMPKPVLSIIGTIYNQAKASERALDIWCRQNFNLPYEIIILDDGSTDETREVVESFQTRYPEKIRYFYFNAPHHIRNCTLLFNTAIKRLMRSEIAVIQWYDRIPSSFDALSALYAPHLENSNVLVTFLTRHILGSSSRDVFDEVELEKTLSTVEWRSDPGQLKKIMGEPGGHCFPQTMNESACFSVPRRALLDIGGYDERYFKVANYSNVELYGRLKASGWLDFQILEDFFTFHQPHPSNREDIQIQIDPDEVILRNVHIRENWGSLLPSEFVPKSETQFTIVSSAGSREVPLGMETVSACQDPLDFSQMKGEIVAFVEGCAPSPDELRDVARRFERDPSLGCVAPNFTDLSSPYLSAQACWGGHFT